MTRFAPYHALPRSSTVDRESYVLEQCRGHKVLHVGCASWPFTKTLFERGQLLHVEMDSICSELAGVDVSGEGIEFLRAHSFKNLFVRGGEDPRPVLEELGWTPELVVLGEILEHVDAPGPLLRAWAQALPESSRLLITVPNAFSLKGFIHVLLGREKVNVDHVAYYSYATMSQLLRRSGLEPVDVKVYREVPSNVLEKLVDFFAIPLMYLRPHLRNGVIFSARPTRADKQDTA